MEERILETERLILRPWMESDAESLYQYAKDPAVGPIAGWPPHTSVENSRNIIRDILSVPETYAVVLKGTNNPIGSVGIMFGDNVHSADKQDHDAEIGYWLGVPFWGRGLIPEAVNRLLERCFKELKIKRVWCGYYDGNIKSRRVMDKCIIRKTKCSGVSEQNVPFLKTKRTPVNLFSLPFNPVKKHRKNLLLRCFFTVCLFGYIAKNH